MGDYRWRTAHNGSTGKLQVIATEDLQAFIKEQWYKQDMPSGIYSLHKALTLTHLGVSRPAISEFVKKQKAWQMLKPLPTKGKQPDSDPARRALKALCLVLLNTNEFAYTR